MKSRFKIINVVFLLLLSFSSLKAFNNDEIVIGKYINIYSEELEEMRTVLISLPDDYGKTSDCYPLLFVLDGSVEAMIEAKADLQMAKYCYSPEMIIVAIKNTDRLRDMLPGSGSANKFLKFITAELFPFIKNEYRVDENQRILYGGSNAGLFTIFSFLDNPDNFTGYIASSPTICHRKNLMMEKVKDLAQKDIIINKFVYIIYGDIDYPEVTDTLTVFLPYMRALQQKGLRLKVEYLPEDGHVPFGSLQFGLMAMYNGYSYPSDKLEREGLDSIKAYYDRYSKRVGYIQKPPKQKILFMGQEMMKRSNYGEAANIFKYCSEMYSGDYYSTLLLAAAYFKMNELNLAKEKYLLAKEIKNKIKELNDPPIDEWKEMKSKFES